MRTMKEGNPIPVGEPAAQDKENDFETASEQMEGQETVEPGGLSALHWYSPEEDGFSLRRVGYETWRLLVGEREEVGDEKRE